MQVIYLYLSIVRFKNIFNFRVLYSKNYKEEVNRILGETHINDLFLKFKSQKAETHSSPKWGWQALKKTVQLARKIV